MQQKRKSSSPKAKSSPSKTVKRVSEKVKSGVKTAVSRAKVGAKRVSAHVKANKKAYGSAAALAALAIGAEVAYRKTGKLVGDSRKQTLEKAVSSSRKYLSDNSKRISKLAMDKVGKAKKYAMDNASKAKKTIVESKASSVVSNNIKALRAFLKSRLGKKDGDAPRGSGGLTDPIDV
jgi:hypothetical protein